MWGSEFTTKDAQYMGDSAETTSRLTYIFWNWLRAWRWWCVTASLPSGTAEQMRDLQEPSEFYFFVGRVAISSREIAHMQVGQCGNQEAYAEILCCRRRWRNSC